MNSAVVSRFEEAGFACCSGHSRWRQSMWDFASAGTLGNRACGHAAPPHWSVVSRSRTQTGARLSPFQFDSPWRLRRTVHIFHQVFHPQLAGNFAPGSQNRSRRLCWQRALFGPPPDGISDGTV